MPPHYRIPILLLMIIGLSVGCAPAGMTPHATASPIAPSPTPSPTVSPAPSPTASSTETPTATPTPAVAVPVYPHISLPPRERLAELFQAGARAGMRPGVFSKVGDSLTANTVFLVPFGTGAYDLGEYAVLQGVIEYFSRETARTGNSFANVSLAARSGWHAQDVLDPALAAADCAAGKSPLECEYRIVRPEIAVILLGTNDVASPKGDFSQRLKGIVGLTLSRGILPVLSTLPAMDGKDVAPFNAAIRDAAAFWNVPLIDLYAALLPLPHHGLGPDGMHLSWVDPADFRPPNLQYGMTMRNLVTLQALDALWKSGE